MNKTPEFLFDRTLNNEELNFWTNFLDNFPFHRQAYTQALISYFSKNFTESIDLDESYKTIQEFKTKEELVNYFKKDGASIQFIENYPLIIDKLDTFFPNSKPVQLFLMSLYVGCIQNMNFEISSTGIHILPTDRKIKVSTYIPELAFIVDFMGQRANEIFPNLNMKSVTISGEVALKEKSSDESYVIKVENNIVKRFLVTEKENIFEFGYDFSQNSDDRKDIYSPLQYEQKRLLRAIQDYYLRNSLEINSLKPNNKLKI